MSCCVPNVLLFLLLDSMHRQFFYRHNGVDISSVRCIPWTPEASELSAGLRRCSPTLMTFRFHLFRDPNHENSAVKPQVTETFQATKIFSNNKNKTNEIILRTASAQLNRAEQLWQLVVWRKPRKRWTLNFELLSKQFACHGDSRVELLCGSPHRKRLQDRFARELFELEGRTFKPWRLAKYRAEKQRNEEVTITFNSQAFDKTSMRIHFMIRNFSAELATEGTFQRWRCESQVLFNLENTGVITQSSRNKTAYLHSPYALDIYF